MEQSSKPKRERGYRGIGSCALVCWMAGATAVQAQAPCVEISLRGLPDAVRAGQRVRLTAELDSGCNYKVVDSATLSCVYPDGSEERRSLDLSGSNRGPTRAAATLKVPEVGTTGEVECAVEFSQCNEEHRTCPVIVRFEGPEPETIEEGVAPTAQPRQPPVPSESWRRRRASPPPPAPEPPPPSPSPPRNDSRGGGRFVRGLGWIGVGVGVGVYADAGSKEQEGRFEESQESEELANQILAGSSVLLLIGYAIDGNGFLEEPEVAPRRRVQPSLSIDPFHRAVMLRVSVRFD